MEPAHEVEIISQDRSRGLDCWVYSTTLREQVMAPQLPPIKSKLDVRVVTFVDPSNFFIHPIQTMDPLIQELKKTSYLNVNNKTIAINAFYIGWCTDFKEYRRVQVLRQSNKPFFYDVYCVDFGENTTTHCSNLLHLTPELAVLPAQAIRARLHGVKPVGDGDWSEQNVLFFKKVLEKGNTFSADVISITPDGTLDLQLCDRSGNNEVAVAQYLIDNLHASLASQ